MKLKYYLTDEQGLVTYYAAEGEVVAVHEDIDSVHSLLSLRYEAGSDSEFIEAVIETAATIAFRLSSSQKIERKFTPDMTITIAGGGKWTAEPWNPNAGEGSFDVSNEIPVSVINHFAAFFSQ